MANTPLSPGMTAVLKTTEEPVFILKIRDQSDPDGLGQIASVRRPKNTSEGLVYVIDEFYLSELETMEDRMERTMKEMTAFRGKHKSLDPLDVIEQIN